MDETEVAFGPAFLKLKSYFKIKAKNKSFFKKKLKLFGIY